MKAAIYVRHENDLPKLREFCMRRGWTVAAEFIDEDQPPAARDQMLAEVGAFDVVLVNKFLDIGLSFKDVALTAGTLTWYRRSIISASEPLMTTDTRTRHGRTLAQLFYTLAGRAASAPPPVEGWRYWKDHPFGEWREIRGGEHLHGIDFAGSFGPAPAGSPPFWFLQEAEQPDTEA